MQPDIVGKRIILSPLTGESEFEEELEGEIEGTISRQGFRETWDYYVVKLRRILRYHHPGLKRTLDIDRVLVMPDDTMLEWAFYGGGPPGLPVLIKVFALVPTPDNVTDYSRGEIFLLARAAAKSLNQ